MRLVLPNESHEAQYFAMLACGADFEKTVRHHGERTKRFWVHIEESQQDASLRRSLRSLRLRRPLQSPRCILGMSEFC